MQNIKKTKCNCLQSWRQLEYLPCAVFEINQVYNHMKMNMDEGPQLTPSQAPAVHKSSAIFISDNTVTWNRAQQLCPAVLLHTLFSSWQSDGTRPPSQETHAEIQTWRQRCEGVHRRSQNQRRTTPGELTHAWFLFEVGFWTSLFSLCSFYTHKHTVSGIQVKHEKEWLFLLSAGMKQGLSISFRETRLSTSCLKSHYCQSGRIHSTLPQTQRTVPVVQTTSPCPVSTHDCWTQQWNLEHVLGSIQEM